ncbi:peptidylprolyl isomerase [Tenacibaculum sp. 190524A05c]|uniref:peptidylprolyl isomerase n=1 Tax=Tenacibaculum platacis TaxID=3137852 RepID=UPI0031FB6F91
MMQLRIMNLKSISLSLFVMCASLNVFAQKVKIDGVAVVVGKNIVLDSDIAKFKQEVELRSEGKVKISNCEMLEELMQQKLLAHHAVVDSVTVSKSEVDSRVDRSIQFFTQEYGDVDAVVKAYGFNDLEDLKKELSRVQKENALIEKEQVKVTEDIDVTPEEVRLYFNGLKDDGELPEFPAEVGLSQIVIKAVPTKEEEQRVIDKLTEVRRQIVEDGASFKLKAIINSEEPNVGQTGGFLGAVTKDTPFIKEFKEVVFTLDEGQISEPFKTDFGYHIVLLHKIKGKGREVSHILMRPEVSDDKLKKTKAKLDSIKVELVKGNLTFEDAVKKYSQDKETKNSGGVIVNPYTGDTTFELIGMDPALYGRINELQEGEYSEVFYDETRTQEKMYKLILMKSRTNTHTADLVKDYVKVQKLALAKKKEETIEKWSKDKILETYIKLGDDYKKCTFKANWKKEN